MSKYKKGFTLIEIIIVVVIVSIISRIVFVSFRSLEYRQTLQAQVDQIASTIQKTRLDSLNSKYGVAHSIRFGTTSFSISNQSTSTIETFSYVSGVRLASYTMSTNTIQFAKVTGLPSVSGTLVYTFNRGSSVLATSTVIINGLGVLE